MTALLDAAHEMFDLISASDFHSYCALQNEDGYQCTCGHEAELDRWQQAIEDAEAHADPVAPKRPEFWYWMTKDEHGPIAHAWNGEKIPHPDAWYLTKVAVCGWPLENWGLRLYQHLDLPDTAVPCAACEAILARGDGRQSRV